MPPLMAFTAQTVQRLTGLSDRQLRYWDDTGFFVPTFADENRRSPHSRVYSFRDLVGLRTIARLLEHGVSLQELRKVGAWLAEHYDEPWSGLRFRTFGKRVYVVDPATRMILQASHPQGQGILWWFLKDIAVEMEDAIDLLQVRRSDEFGRVVQDRYIMNNAPVIAGTRITTAAISDAHAAGMSHSDIIADYPRLTDEDIAEAIAWERAHHDRRVAS
ncbi:MAG: DUF433 domain-containing protein [Chloroflexota bacterium]|nr:DUF433 domain-containing protein [Chloroflexota bacterium]